MIKKSVIQFLLKGFVSLFIFSFYSASGQNKSSDPPLVPFSNGINFGFKDTLTKKIAIMPVYNGAGFFYGKYAKVKVNEKWGVINKKGDRIIEIKYDSLHILKNNIFLCYIKDKCYLLNDSKLTIGSYDHFLKFEDNDSKLPKTDIDMINNSWLGNSVLYFVNNGGQYLNVIKTDTVKVELGNGMSTKYFIEKKSFPYIKKGSFFILNERAEPLFTEETDAVKFFIKIYKPTEKKDEFKGLFLVDISSDSDMTKTGKRYIDLSKPIYIRQNGFWKIINSKGEKISDLKFDNIEQSLTETYGYVGTKKFLISDNGKTISEF